MAFGASGYSLGDPPRYSSGMASTAPSDRPDLVISRIRDSRLFPG
jgi:hypothetical protein